MGDARVVCDGVFESLSVTAQNWIDVQELPVKRVGDYLRGMRDDGWCVVGLEQTSNSTPLQHFKFASKTIILLGNERSGIPVDLIQLMDHCVEIPQVGVVRSLNVHVSGALIIWEGLKQRIAT